MKKYWIILLNDKYEIRNYQWDILFLINSPKSFRIIDLFFCYILLIIYWLFKMSYSFISGLFSNFNKWRWILIMAKVIYLIVAKDYLAFTKSSMLDSQKSFIYFTIFFIFSLSLCFRAIIYSSSSWIFFTLWK